MLQTTCTRVKYFVLEILVSEIDWSPFWQSSEATSVDAKATSPSEGRRTASSEERSGTASSYLTLWPSDASQPLASNLNWQANDGATPNKVDVKIGADGRVNIFNNAGTVDVIADVVGYYADHNHDDRYYTKTQVDAAVQAAVAQARTFVHLRDRNDSKRTSAAPFECTPSSLRPRQR